MKTLSRSKIIEDGRELYYKLRPNLEKKYGLGDYVSFDVQSGDYFVGKTPIQSLHKAKKNIPIENFSLHKLGVLPES